jgi:hypothetical protein
MVSRINDCFERKIKSNLLGGTFDFQALAKRLWGDVYYNTKT